MLVCTSVQDTKNVPANVPQYCSGGGVIQCDDLFPLSYPHTFLIMLCNNQFLTFFAGEQKYFMV